MTDRWSLYIDIEGFSFMWSERGRAIAALGELMEGIFRIGEYAYPDPGQRLFAHQVGDGFFVVSDGPEESLDRPVCIAVALMRHVAASGYLARATIGEGGFADVTGCYPSDVLRAIDPDDGFRVNMGAGLMMLFNGMGSAVIDAVAVDKRGPRGPLLLIGSDNDERVGAGFERRFRSDAGVMCLDWMTSVHPDLAAIQAKTGLSNPPVEAMRDVIREALSSPGVSPRWRDGVDTCRMLS